MLVPGPVRRQQREVKGYKEDRKTSGERGEGVGLRGSLPMFDYEGRREGHL